MYSIKLDQGDYFQVRNGNDWGRCDWPTATPFDSHAEADQYIRRLRLSSFGAVVVDFDEDDESADADVAAYLADLEED